MNKLTASILHKIHVISLETVHSVSLLMKELECMIMHRIWKKSNSLSLNVNADFVESQPLSRSKKYQRCHRNQMKSIWITFPDRAAFIPTETPLKTDIAMIIKKNLHDLNNENKITHSMNWRQHNLILLIDDNNFIYGKPKIAKYALKH